MCLTFLPEDTLQEWDGVWSGMQHSEAAAIIGCLTMQHCIAPQAQPAACMSGSTAQRSTSQRSRSQRSVG